MRLQFS